MRLGAEVGPEEGRDGAEDLDGVALDGVVRDGALRLFEVGLADPEEDVRTGAFKLFDVGRFAEVALFAADRSFWDIPLIPFDGLSEPTPTGMVIPTSAPTGPAARNALRPTAPATREAVEVLGGVFFPYAAAPELSL